ncbi:MAG: polysaccharide deacetylase family protein [Ktedonobacteraceae bacterium]|nr:polysaccharide deacetylase family protein [Ktedonobacteraceae bacterium]
MSTLAEKKKIPILMYHSISHDAAPKFKRFAVSPVLFSEHMAYLYQHAYTAVTVTQLVQALSQGSGDLPEKPVVLTFDDGFSDFYTEALPVLKQHSFVATLYLVTAFINGTSRWLRREGEAARPMLTWDQIASISEAGIECGGHTHTHPELDTLPLSRAREEIVQCKRLLEQQLGQEVLSFAYPYGYHTTGIKQLVRDAGYTSACAVKYEMTSETTDPFALTRLIVSADMSVNELANALTQGTSPIVTLSKRIATPMWRFARQSSAVLTRHTHHQQRGFSVQ